MDAGEIIIVILAAGLLVGFFVGLFWLNRLEKRLKEKDNNYVSPKRDIKDVDNYEPEEKQMKVTVVDMVCSSRLVGTKEPKSVQSYIIRFEDEYGKQFDIPVIEEYYDSFDINQVGLLTLVDGEFYSFELEESK